MSKQLTDSLLLSIIDDGLDALGESGKKAVWFYLQQDPNFSREKIPQNLESFEKALQNLFGLGYDFLESLFRRDLQDATGKDLSKKRSLSECVSYLRAET